MAHRWFCLIASFFATSCVYAPIPHNALLQPGVAGVLRIGDLPLTGVRVFLSERTDVTACHAPIAETSTDLGGRFAFDPVRERRKGLNANLVVNQFSMVSVCAERLGEVRELFTIRSRSLSGGGYAREFASSRLECEWTRSRSLNRTLRELVQPCVYVGPFVINPSRENYFLGHRWFEARVQQPLARPAPSPPPTSTL
ncbi:MAG: hypothetical protein ACFB2Z_02340 [Maricaulaceae bacterium]